MVKRRLALLALATAAAALALLAPAAARADVVWLCKPGMADNPCEIGMATTVREQSAPERVEDTPTPDAAQRPVDCFYVYPTVSNQPTPNANKDRDPELDSIARYQAARFAPQCRIFAPIYRQGTLASLSTSQAQDTEAIRRTAFADVQEAWREYLARDNGGRGVVLLGHSQGTRMLRQLIRTDIDGNPAVRRRLVSALLIGGNVTVRGGQVAGGDFANVPLCTQPAQTGCAVAYSTFAQDPPENPRYGKVDDPRGDPFGFPSGPEFEVACTDPSALSGRGDPLRLVVPSEPYAPGPIAAGIVITGGGPPPSAATPWVVPADRWTGGCATINGARVLRYEPTPGSRRPNPFPDQTWGTHLIDVNLTLDKLVEIVRLQTERHLQTTARGTSVRLTRRCVGRGRLRVRLVGDAGRFAEVGFKVGRRQLARDRTRPFERVLSRRALLRRTGPLRAVARPRAGGRALVLTRSLPSCRPPR